MGNQETKWQQLTWNKDCDPILEEKLVKTKSWVSCKITKERFISLH